MIRPTLLCRAKLFLRAYIALPCFCKRCGRAVTDFSAPDDVWQLIEQHIAAGSVLCFDCFVKACRKYLTRGREITVVIPL